MGTYTVRLTQAYKVVLGLVFIPLLIVPFIVSMAYITIPEWLVIVLIVAFLGAAIAATVFVVKRLTPLVQYSFDGDTHRVEVIEKAFYNVSSFSFTTNDIRNFWIDETNGRYYFTLSISQYPHKFSINAASKSDEDETQFAELMTAVTEIVNNRNSESGETVIASTTMYETWWAKLLSVFAILVFIAALVLIAFFPDVDFPWWRLLLLVGFGVPFVMKVYHYNYKKKE
ncbi:MAG: hypothetical protein KIS94_11610 [Chitinophagales bacterium]|nr:hypothetical protein [Chitinophagales bacterium]